MSLRFGEQGSDRLVFQTDDLGATLQLLNVADDVTGGRLTVDGQLSEIAGRRTLRGHIEGQNYTLVRAPVMARILALPSLTGFASTLAGTGLPFSTLRGDFAYDGSLLTLDRMLAFGAMLVIRGINDMKKIEADSNGCSPEPHDGNQKVNPPF